MSGDADDLKLGFLAISEADGSYAGGLLVTNDYGQPLEFRCTTQVTPTRAQQILYGGTLERFVKVDLIGEKLMGAVENTPSVVLVEEESCLELRAFSTTAIAHLREADQSSLSDEAVVLPGYPDSSQQIEVQGPPEHQQELDIVQDLLATPATKMSLLEPFQRVRDALEEVATAKK